MKFIEKFSGVGRIGALTEIPAVFRSMPIKTPMCLTYTCSGSAPHLTRDVLHYVDKCGLMLQTMPTIADLEISVEKIGLGQFVGLPEHPMHISMQNPAVTTPSGYNVKKGVAVWSHGGKMLFTPEQFMKIQNSFRPFSYQALCDSDTPRNCSKKRLVKSVDNTLAFLDQCLKLHSDLPRLKDSAIFGSIEGGRDIDLRKKSAVETSKRNVDGFIIDGFHLNGPIVRDMDFLDIKPILCEVVAHLSPEKPRMMNGPLNPYNIIEAVKCGVDMFDSSYSYVLTEAGEALVLPFLSLTQNELQNVPQKTCKHVFEIDLNDPFYADKFQPISNHCKCYTCKNFTCAYIHHLLVTSELSAKVLLMLHNMFQMLEFFSKIREAIEIQSLDVLQKQLNAHI